MGTKRGGKSGWSGGSPAPSINSIPWETIVPAQSMPIYTKNMTFNAVGNAGYVYGWEEYDNQSGYPHTLVVPIHENYDVSKGIQVRLFGNFMNNGSGGTHVFSIQSIWRANMDTLNVTFTNNEDIRLFAPTTAHDLNIVSELKTFVPDGSFSKDKTLLTKIIRTDSESDSPFLSAIKFKYFITI